MLPVPEPSGEHTLPIRRRRAEFSWAQWVMMWFALIVGLALGATAGFWSYAWSRSMLFSSCRQACVPHSGVKSVDGTCLCVGWEAR